MFGGDLSQSEKAKAHLFWSLLLIANAGCHGFVTPAPSDPLLQAGGDQGADLAVSSDSTGDKTTILTVYGDDSKLQLTGDWVDYQNGSGTYKQDEKLSFSSGSTASLIEGHVVGYQVYSTKGPNRGKMEVFIDGKSQGVANLTQSDWQTSQLVFKSASLSSSLHQLTIKNVSDNSNQAQVGIDKIVVIQEKVKVGAIRWDAWVGPMEAVGRDVEASMGPAKYHYRLPFYGKETGFNSVEVRAITQEVIDQEILFASKAGLDYWAFLYYEAKTGLDQARKLYLQSQYKDKIKFCFVVQRDRLNSQVIDEIVASMEMPNYQKVADGRPLLYLLNSYPTTVNYINQLRIRASAQSLKDPYIVFMNMGGDAPAGIDAHSMYAFPSGKGIPYAQQITNESAQWDKFRTEGKRVIPWITTGWDKRPRRENPVSWESPSSADNWIQVANPRDLATALQKAVNFTKDYPNTTEANSVLLYAWNEFDEGGWICPTKYYGADRLNALATVLEGETSAIRKSPTYGTNLAKGKTTRASSTSGNFLSSLVVDGNEQTGWSAAGFASTLPRSSMLSVNEWLEIDFGAPTRFNQTVIKATNFNRITSYALEYFDGTQWIPIFKDTWVTPFTPQKFPHVTANKIRMRVLEAVDNPIVYEFEVYNTP